jgi:hypothetical protein
MAFEMQKNVNLWPRDKSPNWHLAMLITLQRQLSWSETKDGAHSLSQMRASGLSPRKLFQSRSISRLNVLNSVNGRQGASSFSAMRNHLLLARLRNLPQSSLPLPALTPCFM